MKTNTLKYTIGIVAVLFFVACSTKKNTIVSRNYNALTTRDNILYNGNIALNKGVTDLKTQYKDNFWEILPVERMQVVEEKPLGTEEKPNSDFEKSESKATKAIQKHSMNIDGTEKNPQIDEAYLLLGKTRYYDQRFIPALEAFNYVLYKYPTSDKINEAKIWREKTNMRLENDETAIKNLNELLKDFKFKDQVFADANATLAQAYLNTEQNQQAIAKLKSAIEFTKSNEEKARYHFILGQIYDNLKHKDSAYAEYQKVIDMNRKAARQYVIQAIGKQIAQFDYTKGDTLAFLKKYKDLLKDRENRPFLDQLNHQLGLVYDRANKPNDAIKYYNKSIKTKSGDTYLVASNYRNLAEINFNKAKYVAAGKYYDSTLVNLDSKTREFKLITKKRANLDDVIKFEGIAQRNDSILKVSALSSSDKEKYYADYIEKLKKDDIKKKELADKKAKEKAENGGINSEDASGDSEGTKKTEGASKINPKDVISKPSFPTPTINNGIASTFYFYNPSTIAFGKVEFKKKWGAIPYVENWKFAKENDTKSGDTDNNDKANASNDDKSNQKLDVRYTTDFYLKQLPSGTKILDSIGKERNFAYYQLGSIYKEKFKEYKRAADKYETLLSNNPEERLVLPTMYNLYKIYEIIDPSKAEGMKNQIVAKYPDSRYAQIITNPKSNESLNSTPETAYNNLFKDYEKGLYREVLAKAETAIAQFTGEEMLPKFELLKANLIGKLKGVAEYKKALNYVALTYPNSEEGKSTEEFIATKIPYLESLTFNSEIPKGWNLLFNGDNLESKEIKTLIEKLNKYNKDNGEKLLLSTDIYTIDKNFIVLHGLKTDANAREVAQVLKDYKDYKIAQPSIIISNENYTVVQVKKNIDDYVSGDWLHKPVVPVAKNVPIPQPKKELPKTQMPEVKKPTENGGKTNTATPPQINNNQQPANNRTREQQMQQMKSDDAKSMETLPQTPKRP